MTEPLDPLSFLIVAKELASQGAGEAKLRTAVGRAYYAVFLVARGKTGITTKRDVHTQVIQALKRRRPYRGTAEQVDMLRRLRTVADYELIPQNPHNSDWTRNWSTAQAVAERVLARLSSW